MEDATSELPPLVDLSIEGRAYRGAIGKFKEYCALLAKGLDARIENCTDDRSKPEIVAARARLIEACEKLTRSADQIADRRHSAAILYAAANLLMAGADVASRIDRNLLPPLIERNVKRAVGTPGGKASGKVRRAEVAETWKPHALDLARQSRNERPDITQAALADQIAAAWNLKIHCPRTQLIAAIRAWEKSGEVAKRKNR